MGVGLLVPLNLARLKLLYDALATALHLGIRAALSASGFSTQLGRSRIVPVLGKIGFSSLYVY